MNEVKQDWAAARVATSALLATLDHVAGQLREGRMNPPVHAAEPEHMPDFMKEFFGGRRKQESGVRSQETE
jgi:hypothetical protein